MARHRRMSTQFRIRLFSTTRYGNGIRRVSVRMYEPTQLYNQLSSRQYRFLPRTTLFNFGRVFSPLLYLFQRCARFFPRGHCLLCVQMPQFRNIFFFLTWETCLDFNMCHPTRGIVVYNWSRVVHQKIEITNPSVLCVPT